jgi:tellurite resistance protein TerC
VLFSYFKVPQDQQYRVLFWGIIGALVMRGIFIVAGVVLINRFHFIIYVFGAFLIYTGIKLAFQDETEVHPEHNPVLKLVRRWFPMTNDYVGGRFFIEQAGVRHATPLFAVLVVVETTDLLFAVDSIPAILAITRDPFIVYTSNVFAILGLRSMYFALSGMLEVFHHLNYGLAAILSFVGVKMLLSNDGFELWGIPLHAKIPIHVSLAVVASMLFLSIIASILFPDKKKQERAAQREAG